MDQHFWLQCIVFLYLGFSIGLFFASIHKESTVDPSAQTPLWLIMILSGFWPVVLGAATVVVLIETQIKEWKLNNIQPYSTHELESEQ